jgi:hypothetical protein
MCGNVGETNWFWSFLTWAWIWWGAQEVDSMLIDVIFLFELQGLFFMNVQNFAWIGDSYVNLV